MNPPFLKNMEVKQMNEEYNNHTNEPKEHEVDALYTATGVADHTGQYEESTSSQINATINADSYLVQENNPSQEYIAPMGDEESSRNFSTNDNRSNHSFDMPPEKKKSQVPLGILLAATVALSGVSGYTGSYLANQRNTPPAVATSGVPTAANVSTPGLSVSQVVSMAADSVVEITTEKVTRDGFFGQFVGQGAGSGVIIREDGYILTNNHVIDGASKITVRLKDGTTHEAKLKGTDRRLDVAVIKIDVKNLKTATYGDSSALTVGETAIAIGNPLGELGGTVTSGIISALNRDILVEGSSMNLLQTSAAVNPGNSGGGLFNARGELIGIVSAKSSGNNIEGIGFALPINEAKTAAEAIIKDGYVKGRVMIGISLAEIKDKQAAQRYGLDKTGVYVADISRENGFKSGDRIISVEGQKVTTAEQVKAVVAKHKAGDKLRFEVDRSGNVFELTVPLTEDKE